MSQYFAITSKSGPSARRGTGNICMPSACKRANSTAQPGSSTITASPALSKVRLTTSSACVAPTVLMIWLGAALMFICASLLDSDCLRFASPMGSPYSNENCFNAAGVVTLRTAALKKGLSNHSGGNTPMPGCGLGPAWRNMPRISMAAFTGAGVSARMVAGVCVADTLGAFVSR